MIKYTGPFIDKVVVNPFIGIDITGIERLHTSSDFTCTLKDMMEILNIQLVSKNAFSVEFIDKCKIFLKKYYEFAVEMSDAKAFWDNVKQFRHCHQIRTAAILLEYLIELDGERETWNV